MKIGHVISPFLAPSSSDLHIAQPLTFESMRRAAAFSVFDVELMAFPSEERDRSVIPDDFSSLPTATRTSADIVRSTTKRSLPLIADIVSAALAASEADVLVYSNADISLQPYFYDFVAEELESNDAVVINRRTVIRDMDKLDRLSFFYSQSGERHPGFDCFAARRETWEQSDFDTAIVGANWIGRIILLNLLTFARRFRLEADRQLTFHLGDDRVWTAPAMAAYHAHNNQCLIRICRNLIGRAKDKKRILEQARDAHLTHNTSTITPAVRALQHSDDDALPQNPVFVMGFPRSGTTLVQVLIERGADDIVTPPETHFFNQLRRIGKGSARFLDQPSIATLLTHLEKKIELSTELKERLTRPFHEIAVKLVFERIVEDLLRRHYEGIDLQTRRWLEKTPSHALSIELLNEFYPGARFVYMVRHPVFCFTSWMKNAHKWGAGDLNVTHLCQMNEQHWRTITDFQERIPERITILKLEELVTDTVGTLANLARFLGYDRLARSSLTEGSASHVMTQTEDYKRDAVEQPVSPSIAFPAKILCNQSDFLEIERALAPYLRRFGYTDNYETLLETAESYRHG